MKGKKGKVYFKDYQQDQLLVLPPSLSELIDKNHPVRVVNEVIDRISLEPLYKALSGGGAPVFNPKMMLKVLIYGYVSNIYSSRKLEAALKENVHFMWLAAMNKPDHNTINRFRSNSLKDSLKEVFTQVVLLLSEEGLLSLNEAFIDGTKLEATSGRYTFVWAKSIKTNKEKMVKQLKELWDYSQKIAEKENAEPDEFSFEPITPEKVTQVIEKIDQALEQKQVSKKVKSKLNYARKNWPGKLEKYEAQEEILGDRNSYSKTDTDATFMRMKEDHMGNGQLKPAYNCQISTSGQFITNYTIHQTPTDTTTLCSHLTQFKDQYGTMPAIVCADAGYGSEENYQFLDKSKTTAVVKYNTFRIEKTKKWLLDPSKIQNLYYNKDNDYYVCPMGQHMHCSGTYTKKTATGFVQTIKKYRAHNCEGCPMRGVCFKARLGNRQIEANQNLNTFKKKAKAMLESELGKEHRSRRPIEVESVFGNIKQNHNFRRLMLRGIRKVEIEFGLLAMAQNIRKKAVNELLKAL